MRQFVSTLTTALVLAWSSLLGLPGCGSDGGASSANGAVVAADVSSDAASTLGDLATLGARLDLPANTFDEDVTITLQTLAASEAQSLVNQQYTLLGQIVSVTVEGRDSIRLDKPASITFAVAPEQLAGIASADDVYAAYYNRGQWEFFFPDNVDLNTGSVRLSTYHFSSYAAAQLTVEQQLNLFATQMATQSWAKQEQEQNFIRATQEYVNELFATTLGIEDTNLTRIVLQSIVKENDFGSLMVSLADNDLSGFNTKFAEIAGKALLAHMDLDEEFMAGASTVTTAYSQASAELTEGDASSALKTLSSALLQTNALGKIFTVGVAVADTAIKDWRDKSIEDAYQAYKNGSNSHGYDVDALQFPELLAQMRGIGHKIYSDGIAAYCLRMGVTAENLSQVQLESIRYDVETRLKQEFDGRLAREQTTDDAIAYHQKIIAAFERNLLLQKGAFRYDVSLPLEMRLHRLYNVMNQVLDHTGLTLTTSGTAAEGEITLDEVCSLIGIWYTDETPTKEAYFAAIRASRSGGSGEQIPDPITQGSYAWVLVEVKNYPNEAGWATANAHISYTYEASCAQGSYSAKTIYDGQGDESYSPPKVPGEALAAQAQWSAAPATINPTAGLTLDLTISVTEDTQSFFSFKASTKAYFDQADIEPGSATGGAVDLTNADGEYFFEVGRTNPSYTETLSAQPRSGSGSGDRIALLTTFYMGVSMGTGYVYEWQPMP